MPILWPCDSRVSSQKIAAFSIPSMKSIFYAIKVLSACPHSQNIRPSQFPEKYPCFACYCRPQRAKLFHRKCYFSPPTQPQALANKRKRLKHPALDGRRLLRKSGFGVFDFLTLRSQHLQMKSDIYGQVMRRKVRARHRHVQLSCTAQGLLQQPTPALFSG